MKKSHLLTFALAAALTAQADNVDIKQVEYYGPIQIGAPIAIGDTTGISFPKAMDVKADTRGMLPKTIQLGDLAPASNDFPAVHILKFNVENRKYGNATLNVKGIQDYQATCDGKDVAGQIALHPGTHAFEIKYATQPNQTDSLSIAIDAPAGLIEVVTDGTRMYTLDDVIIGTRIAGAEMSPSGKYLIATYATSDYDGNVKRHQVLFDAASGKSLGRLAEDAHWMNTADKYYDIRRDDLNGRSIVAIDPATGAESVVAKGIPEGSFAFGPTDDYLMYVQVREGKKANPKAYQVLEPEDRQPGWRDRIYPAIYRYKDAVPALKPLAYGKNNAWIVDISQDGSKALMMSSRSRLEKRPTTVTSIFSVDLNTLAVDTLVWEDGFVADARFSPDAKQVLVMGTPEAFDRIGCVLPDSVTPSMIQEELFLVDVDSKKVKPISRDFDPNPQGMEWNKADGKIYVRAEKRELYAIYKYDDKTGKFVEIQLPEQLPAGFSMANDANAMAWWGQSDSNPARLYVTNLKTGKSMMIDSPMAERLQNVRLANCQDWNFVNEKGDTIYGRFYLPDNFDPNKKYPLIVNYYGGCSPSQRFMESRYPWHVYSELGYVAYVIQPSGATGFGQEFSSRHVNTAGRGPAEDIIEGTKKFVEAHPYVDADKIGCIGASYGGFMTQYLQTLTDMFAAAISHAGISDHTSYWGEGYWGYSYSEVSMANSYPWSETDLYVKQSPLYNADKITTPILFLHGDSDNNVPVGESIQMFTALKLLGRPTALVEIEGQDHHITDFEKRRLWQDTIFAWFAKYLQDDDTWWNSMYE